MKILKYILLIPLFSCNTIHENQKIDKIPNPPKPPVFPIYYLVKADTFSRFYENCQLSNDVIKKRESGNGILFHHYETNSVNNFSSSHGFYNEIYFQIKNEQLTHGEQFNFEPYELGLTFDASIAHNDTAQSLNYGNIRIQRVNDSIFNVNIDIINEVSNISFKDDLTFKKYKAQNTLIGTDTFNRTDSFANKQGLWMEKTDYIDISGFYKDNYFTGTKVHYNYDDFFKYITKVEEFKGSFLTKTIKFSKPKK